MCRLLVDSGACFAYRTAWYFDFLTRTCLPFTYSGCGGNGNRFPDQQQCEQRCQHLLRAVPTAPTRPTPARVVTTATVRRKQRAKARPALLLHRPNFRLTVRRARADLLSPTSGLLAVASLIR